MDLRQPLAWSQPVSHPLWKLNSTPSAGLGQRIADGAHCCGLSPKPGGAERLQQPREGAGDSRSGIQLTRLQL